ncbi:MAG: hypothetical protein ICV77_09545 [Cyanobacteria bacterium Co-bin8]|nr:hypothetical protein [Cyanobacteria bacterium Co-bin8]
MLSFSMTGCTASTTPTADPPPAAVEPATPSSPDANSAADATTTLETLKFKQGSGAEAFSLKLKPDGAKLVNPGEAELARLTVDDAQKVKIKNAQDKPLGYVVKNGDHWKVENAEQSKTLYVLRRQADGDYKLEDGQDQPVYRIKVRDYGYEIETPDKQSLYKIKVKEGKTSLRNAADETVLSTKDAIAPIAFAAFGFEVLTPEQQAALAYSVNLTGGQ